MLEYWNIGKMIMNSRFNPSFHYSIIPLFQFPKNDSFSGFFQYSINHKNWN